MTNLYLRIRWRSAPLLGALLILTGVVGIFIPLMPEIAVILLGMWLVSAAAVTPLWRRRLAPQVGTQPDSSRRKRGLAMDTLVKQLRLHTFLGTALLFPIVLCGCQQKTPEPEKPTVAIENLHIAYTKEVNRQQKYAAFIKQGEKDRLPAVASLYLVVARSEEIHTANHARLLRSQGVAPIPPVRDSVIIGNSLQTLKMAMSDERAEVESLYPNLIQTAALEQYPAAVENFKKTRDADTRHLELFKEALEKKGRMKKVQYVVCAQCGYVITLQATETCPNCSAKRDSFEQI